MTLGRESVSERSHRAELEALTSIAAQVNCTQDLDEILASALRTTLEVVGVDAGEVYLIDEQTRELRLHARQGLSAAFLADEAVLGPGECLCGLAVDSQQVVVATDIESHPFRSRAACMREGFHSLMCLPLRARGEVLGLLNVQSRAPRAFSAADEELMTAIGNQIGIALANARLIDDAEQRRATLDGVMNSLVDGLILVDRRGRIEFANPRAEQMLGLPTLTMVGQTVEAVDGRIAGRLAATQSLPFPLQSAAADSDGSTGVEFALAAPARRTVQVRPFPIQGARGDRLGLGLLLRDITHEKELDEMKSQLLSTVSHELRTPLASIKGFATTLLRDDVDWDEASRHEFLAIIDQESDRLAELISNLLDMSRIEAGTLRLDPELIDVRPIVKETAAGFQALTHVHRLRVRLPASLPLAWADPRRIRQVVGNLLENAIKYSPEGGDITIAVEVLADSLHLSVADEGLGIPPEHVERVFDRFFQVDSASTRDVGGSGLGLSICKAIIEAHRGQIWVESQVGIGSTFHFALPLSSGKGGGEA
jgi:signal transduction histidine kinase